jgi:hypothetical protein
MGILTSLRGAANGCTDGKAIPKRRSTTVKRGECHTGDGKDRSRPEVQEWRRDNWAESGEPRRGCHHERGGEDAD